MADKLRTYSSDEIDVTWSQKRCIHAGECVRGLPAVFDVEKRPWIQPDQADGDTVAEVVERCPTGALHYTRKDGGPGEPTPDANHVTIDADGPLYVRGDLTLEMPGDEDALKDTRIALCRCGASKNKPFCDNSHKDEDVAFKDDGNPAVSQLGPEAAQTPLAINPATNGPYLLRGQFEIVTALGTVSYRGESAALCRCGASDNKPFCDGTHTKIGFEAE